MEPMLILDHPSMAYTWNQWIKCYVTLNISFDILLQCDAIMFKVDCYGLQSFVPPSSIMFFISLTTTTHVVVQCSRVVWNTHVYVSIKVKTQGFCKIFVHKKAMIICWLSRMFAKQASGCEDLQTRGAYEIREVKRW